MKKYYDNKNDRLYFVGTTSEIKATYKSIVRHGQSTNIGPLFVDRPKFSKNKSVYGLCIDRDNWMTVVNSDTMMSLIAEQIITEITNTSSN